MQLMNGNLSIDPSSENLGNFMNLTVRLNLNRSGLTDRLKYKDNETGITFLKRVNILLADGDGLTQSILQRLTNDSGRHLAIAASWFQCIEVIRSSAIEFQLLLIDVHLLEENIREMSSRVRKLKSGGWLMIIALVPYADEEIRERCLRNGVHGVVPKPVIQKEIEEELERIINQSHVAAVASL